VRLYPADVGGGYVVDHLAAGRAVPPSLEGRAACPVGRQSRLTAPVPPGPVGRGPLSEHPEGTGQVGTGRRQSIRVPHGTARVGLAHDQAFGLEAGEAIEQVAQRLPYVVGY